MLITNWILFHYILLKINCCWADKYADLTNIYKKLVISHGLGKDDKDEMLVLKMPEFFNLMMHKAFV